MGEYGKAPELDASGLRVAIVVARFNLEITQALLDGARAALLAKGAADDAVDVYWVPGAFELPIVAKRLAQSGKVDAVVCLGAIIRGETAHFEYVASGTTQGIIEASLETLVPVIFGVLTVDTRQQALDRIGGKDGHKGEEAADTAIEMAQLLRSL